MRSSDPQAEFARLTAYYAQLSESELTELGSQYESLTEAAQAAIRAEFDRRGMPAPELANDELHDLQPLVTIRRCLNPIDAMVAKSALVSAGISAFLSDENTARIYWGTSIALGGIRLRVRANDKAAAEAVLSQPIPPVFEANGTRYEQPRCPSCNSLDISDLWLPPIWTCNTCGAKWEDIPEGNAADS